MDTAKFTVISKEQKPRVVELHHWTDNFGHVEKITSSSVGAERASVDRVTLRGKDVLHSHRNKEETLICLEGEGKLFLDEEIIYFVPGVRVVIKPGVVHAVTPNLKYRQTNIVFLCVSSPPFSPDDVVKDPRGRRWGLPNRRTPLLPISLSGKAAEALSVLMEFRLSGAFDKSEFKGSEDFENVIEGYNIVELLERAREAAERNDLLDGATEEQREAYRIIRGTFFHQKIHFSEPGWNEWNAAIHRSFQELMAGFKWDKIKEEKERLQKFMDKPEDTSLEDVGKLIKFFSVLSSTLN